MARRRRVRAAPPEDHDSAVADWRQNAARRDDANYGFLRSLKLRDDDDEIDATAAALHQRAFRTVDCTRCANCCRTMDVAFNQADVERVAARLGMTPEEFTERFLATSDYSADLVMRAKPCPLLGPDNRCTVYDVRPDGCREFPHTDKPGFVGRTIGHANNARNCPAVFWIVERLREELS